MRGFSTRHLDDLPATPWKNGGGITRELAISPPGAGFDDFLWRVSVADVTKSGPFSMLPGIDRVIVLLEGEGMLLRGPGDTHALVTPFEAHAFAGETPIDAVLRDGATRDFNLMTRRGAAHGTVSVWRGARQQTIALDADAALFFCASGSVALQLGDDPLRHLRAGDTLDVTGATMSCRIHAETSEAVLLAALIQLAPGAAQP